jgi:hypothetical protein
MTTENVREMPNRREHNRVCALLGLNRSIANNVNRDKDLPAKDIPGRNHRGFNHGACANLKYRRLGGTEAMACSVAHNTLDRIRSRQPTFLLERVITWYPSKFIQNSTLISMLDGEWWKTKWATQTRYSADILVKDALEA